MDVVSIGETMVVFTPVFPGKMRCADSFSAKVAGAESNTMIALSRLGYATKWISQVGNDEFGEKILFQLRGERVDVSDVVKTKETTGLIFKQRLNSAQVQVSYYRKGSAASKINELLIMKALPEQAKCVYITGITPALSGTCREAIHTAIRLARERQQLIIFDPNIRRSLWSESEARKELLYLAGESDVILPGKSEAEFLLGKNTPERWLDQFLSLGAATVILKDGSKGAFYKSGGSQGFVPGFSVNELVDPVGAGDAFAAGVISGILDGLSWEQSTRRGCAMGALAVTAVGDTEGLPENKQELEVFMEQKESEDVTR